MQHRRQPPLTTAAAGASPAMVIALRVPPTVGKIHSVEPERLGGPASARVWNILLSSLLPPVVQEGPQGVPRALSLLLLPTVWQPYAGLLLITIHDHVHPRADAVIRIQEHESRIWQVNGTGFFCPQERVPFLGTNTSRPEGPRSWVWKTRVLKGAYDVQP